MGFATDYNRFATGVNSKLLHYTDTAATRSKADGSHESKVAELYRRVTESV